MLVRIESSTTFGLEIWGKIARYGFMNSQELILFSSTGRNPLTGEMTAILTTKVTTAGEVHLETDITMIKDLKGTTKDHGVLTEMNIAIEGGGRHTHPGPIKQHPALATQVGLVLDVTMKVPLAVDGPDHQSPRAMMINLLGETVTYRHDLKSTK